MLSYLLSSLRVVQVALSAPLALRKPCHIYMNYVDYVLAIHFTDPSANIEQECIHA